uniref:AlNc14C70G4857 protein n=1 Tax=Albugo laibachii Nc14 TaxID=890382 RepID=F0WDY9_9STRA|nr:AlNc14C70G4857 [Albugo laibachii Nc14]|eukprot:CCA19417.1 AlNc14C70G4857 [Albugo laibachii Nc14]
MESDDDLKNATPLLVERTGINTILASSAFAHYFLRRGSKRNSKRLLRAFEPMMCGVRLHTMLSELRKVARYASRVVIDHADVDVIRLGWNVD